MDRAQADTWEYFTLTAKTFYRASAPWEHSHYEYVDLAALDKAGDQGWEAVSVMWDGIDILAVLMKRRKP